MWGRSCGPRAARAGLGAWLLLSLAACASHRPVASAGAGPAAAPVERDATGAYRFDMTQHGRRMSADEFDAWMKARGIRVAKGAPAPRGRPVAAAGKAPAGRAGAAAPPPARPRAVTGKAAPVVATAKPAVAVPAKPAAPGSVQEGKPKPKRRGDG